MEAKSIAIQPIALLGEEELQSVFKTTASRLSLLKQKGISTGFLEGKKTLQDEHFLKGNIENFIGMAQVPVGLAGPLVLQQNPSEQIFVPLATTEGALVASYSRGLKACRLNGGIGSICIAEGVQRCPVFVFSSLQDAIQFVTGVIEQQPVFHEIVAETSQYAELQEVKPSIEGNRVTLTFQFSTGDASGQNMVTICADKICQYLVTNSAVSPKEWYIEGNGSGDKKATFQSFLKGRGKRVIAEVELSNEVVTRVLKTTPQKMEKYCQLSTAGAIQSGGIGAQGHVANALAALFIACGQDVACVAESSIGITRMEVTQEGNLYVSLTLPALIVGTVGGGTDLPTQQECLQVLGCQGRGSAKRFAEICAAVALAGEVSIISAMSAHHFTRAHEKLGRKK